MNQLRMLVVFVFVASFARAEDSKPTFEANVKPLLNKHCVKCHSGDRPRGELVVTSYAAVMQGGVSGKSVVAGQPGESPLYTMTAHLEEPKMPPNSPKIPQSELDTLKKWIETGAVEKIGSTATPTPKSSPKLIEGLQTVVPLARPTAITALATLANLIVFPGQQQILLYDMKNTKYLGALPFPEGEVHLLRFSENGKTLLAAGGIGGQSGAVVGFDTTTWNRKFTITDNTDAILAADLSTDQTLVAFGGPSRLVKVATVSDGKVVHTFRKPTDWVMSTQFSPDGLLIAAGDRFGGVTIWETKSGKEFLTLRAHTKAVTAMAWRADSDALATTSEDGLVRVWDLHTGQGVAHWEAHSAGVSDLIWTSKSLITAGRDKFIKTWNPAGQAIDTFGPSTDVVLRVATSPDGQSVYSGDWAGNLNIWSKSRSASITLPLKPATLKAVSIPVPTPELAPQPLPVAGKTPVSSSDLARKRETLKAIEDAAEKLKFEAARDPKNTALAKAYLQLCEASLAMKAEVLLAEQSEVKK